MTNRQRGGRMGWPWVMLVGGLAVGTPLAAQEWSGGAMDPAAVSAPMAVQAASAAQAHHRTGKAKGSPARSRQICANARDRMAAGEDDPNLPRLLALCRKGGY
ncbi:hypothetical protein [uncultured Sphingomonas sp.]|uniref:hypothetical protein n=1 Tax=uncultured Sphingomonas sp. TaxID=158754 RepID=UPI0030F6FD33